MNFDFFVRTRILFGANRLQQLGQVATTLGKRVVIVSGQSAHATGIWDRASSILKEAGIKVVASPPVGTDPNAGEVDVIRDVAKAEHVDLIVAIGGGSALDAAKAAGALAGLTDTTSAFIGQTINGNPTALPVIALPTTAGSGAEVTRGAIITDETRGLKSGIRGDDVQPRIAICDPDLLQTMPSQVIADTVFDTFTHLVETTIVRKATPVSQALAYAGLSKLKVVFEQPLDISNPATRENLSLAALLGGINIGTASSALPHRIQQAMGSVSDIRCSHGRGLAVIYRAWLARAQPAAPEGFDAISRILGFNSAESTFDALITRLGLPHTLGAVGYNREHLPIILENVTGNIENDPIPNADLMTISNILEASW